MNDETRPVVWVSHDSGDKNLTPASDFGTLRVLSIGASPAIYDMKHYVDRVTEQLTGRIKPTDYLLLVGSPSIIAVTAAIASRLLDGQLQMLQWDRQERRYIVVRCNVG